MPLIFPLTFGANIGFPIKQTPRFNTIIQTPASGRSQIRIPTMNFPLWDFELDVTYLQGDAQGNNSQWQQLVNFYMANFGAAQDWYFLHPYDSYVGNWVVHGTVNGGVFITRETVVQNTTGASAQLVSYTPTTLIITAYTGTPDGTHGWFGQTSGAAFGPINVPQLNASQIIGTGDGTTVAFGMYRQIISGGAQDLIQNFVNPPTVFWGGGIQSPSSYTIDQYGTITFNSPPGIGQAVSWIGQFYYRCAFSEDKWESLEEDYYQLWTMNGLKFHSVLL